MKTCTKCGETKPLTEFFRNSTACRACGRAQSKEWYAKNRARKIASSAKRQKEKLAEVLDKHRVWRNANPERQKKYARKYYDSHRVEHNVKMAKRRAAKLQATPLWADGTVIKFLYATSRYLSLVSGEEWRVDHVVPLKGAHVCGLHTPHNLRVVPASINRRKHNKFSPN
jgi:uncharacterized Zn finger protein (UPF0148 family)